MNDSRFLIGYYRLSVEDEADCESNSITNQRLLITQYINTRPELTHMSYREFYDDGYSGASMERPAIRQVLQLVRENQVQCIVVKDFSRFSRNYIEMGMYLEQVFPLMGIRFIAVSDHYDSLVCRGGDSDLEVRFKGLLADFYVKDQSVKVKAALRIRRDLGEYCCGSAPYGYRRNPKDQTQLQIVEEEAAIIRRVFTLTNQRYSKTEICRIFNENGIPTPLQSMSCRMKMDHRKAASENLQWTVDMVRKIINDKNYIGCMVYGKTKIMDPGTGKEVPVPRDQWKVLENHHEPVIAREEFEKAQSLQLRHSRKSKFDKSTSLLSGFLKCGNCGRNLSGSKQHHGHILYSCAYSKGKEDTGCFAGKADNRILEIYMLNEIKAYLRERVSREQMEAAMRQKHQKLIRTYQCEITDCEEKQEQLKKQQLRNYERYHEGKLDQKQFRDARAQIKLEQEQLYNRMQELEELAGTEKEFLTKKNLPVERLLEDLGYVKLTREMLEKYVESIFVYDDGRIEICWNGHTLV